MEIQILLQAILLGGLLGMVGQAIRTIVGIKKENDSTNERARAAGQTSVSYYDSLSGKRITISLLIGFATGVLAYISLDPDSGHEFLANPKKNHVLGIIAAGYAGVDFIEGFMNKYLPERSTPSSAPAPTTAEKGAAEMGGPKLPPVPAR